MLIPSAECEGADDDVMSGEEKQRHVVRVGAGKPTLGLQAAWYWLNFPCMKASLSVR